MAGAVNTPNIIIEKRTFAKLFRPVEKLLINKTIYMAVWSVFN